MNNYDKKTIESFSDEWLSFDQSTLSKEEAEKIFNDYFSIFPWHKLPINSSGFDMGCGTGRWAKLVSPFVCHLHCIEPSSALQVAIKNLDNLSNITFHKGYVDDNILPDNSQDFGYSLGVLHHIPNTKNAIIDCVRMLKRGSPFLIYLYYNLDNRSVLFKVIWYFTDLLRKLISRLPNRIKLIFTNIIATFIYYPIARFSLILEKLKIPVNFIPLSYYRNLSFYTMKTDSRDRFGTPLEKRFSKKEIQIMLEDAGLNNIEFSNRAPYWCAVGYKK